MLCLPSTSIDAELAVEEVRAFAPRCKQGMKLEPGRDHLCTADRAEAREQSHRLLGFCELTVYCDFVDACVANEAPRAKDGL